VGSGPRRHREPSQPDDAFAARANATFTALAFVLEGALPLSYSPLNALDATVSGIAIETLVLSVTDTRRDDGAT